MGRRLRAIQIVALAVAGLAGVALADPLSVGARLEPFSLEDQFGEQHEVGESLRAVVCAADMDGADLIEAALEEGGAELLTAADAVFVANISRMPKIITKLFAMRSFRKRSYPMLLDREGDRSADLPGEEGRATILELDRLTIQSIRHFDDAEALRAALAAMGGTPSSE
jgi:hypothetical protein